MKHTLFIVYSILLIQNILFGSSNHFENFPIQDAGRIKPIDTYAEKILLSIHERRSIKDLQSNAIEWLLESLAYPHESYKKNIFKIKSKEVTSTLGLEWRDPHYYSYSEISGGINQSIEYFVNLYLMEEDQKTAIEKQLTNLFINIGTFKSITNSFTCLDPVIEVNHPFIANNLHIDVGSSISYAFYSFNIDELQNTTNQIKDRSNKDIISLAESLQVIIDQANELKKNKLRADPFYKNFNLKIIPSESTWISPWELLDKKSSDITDNQKELMIILEAYIRNYKQGNVSEMEILAISYINKVTENSEIDINMMKRETAYNRSDSFLYSITLYLISFLLLGISWLSHSNLIKKIAFFCLIIGLGYHGYGLINRMIIMQRPPVSTLYESILFVGFIGVLFSTIFEQFRRDGVGIFLATIIGVVLHFVAFGYEDDGETMGVLVAVLNSNFWLATHVTTITIGYGATALASLMGHFYFIIKLLNNSSRSYLKELGNNMATLNLVALFFMLFGTILGGIWADQSWGRFWGWDPKENAALLIVMWQLLMVHLRITGWVRPIEFAFGMIISNIFLAFGWFGVNLLGVGLHSYGFTDSIASNLALFILFELWFAIGIYFLIRDTIEPR
jgi:ABC-type transport system involved in cytochrome c biogenesis permease subunit